MALALLALLHSVAMCPQSNVVGAYVANLSAQGYDHFTRPSGFNGPAERVDVQLEVLRLKKVDQMKSRVSLV